MNNLFNEKKSSTFLDFVFQEADDESPKRNMKVINLKASDNRRQDFTKGSEIEDGPDEMPTDTETDNYSDDVTDDTPPEEPEIDNTDYTVSDDTGEGETGGDVGDEIPSEPTTDDTDYISDEGGEEAPAEEGETEGGEDAGEVPDEPTTDDTDYTSDEGGEEAPAEEGETEGGEDSNSQEETTVESIYKYNLYQKFKRVLGMIDKYSDDLDGIISDDIDINQQYKMLSKKLKNMKELMEDYMIMKFSKVSFTQSMLFYQRIVTGIDIILQTLKRIKDKEIKSKM